MIHYWNEATADWSDFLYATKLFHFFLFSFIFFPFTFFRFVYLLFFFSCIYLRFFFLFFFSFCSSSFLFAYTKYIFSFYFIFLMVSPFLFTPRFFHVLLRLCFFFSVYVFFMWWTEIKLKIVLESLFLEQFRVQDTKIQIKLIFYKLCNSATSNARRCWKVYLPKIWIYY